MTDIARMPLKPYEFNYSVVFVIHGGPLEAKSALLAASLSRYYRPGKIVCRVMKPYDTWKRIGPDTSDLLDRLGIEIQFGHNEIAETYAHGNKISAMMDIDGPAIFLDSDMLLLCPFSWHYGLNADASLKSADVDTYSGGGGSWTPVWQLFGLPVPGRTHTATLTREKMFPYFNAGFIAVRNGKEFSNTWLTVARKIDADARISNKRPWLDQVAIPIALAKLGWKVRELPLAFNFPSHLSPMLNGIPYFSHYHTPDIIRHNRKLLFLSRQLLQENPELRSILSRYDEWEQVLNKC